LKEQGNQIDRFHVGAFQQGIAAADAFKFDAGHTYVGFEINHLGFSQTFGEFTKYDGTLNLDDVSVFAATLPDLNADTVFNLDDVSLFVSEFLLGCP
jgi:hypothetical protein